MGLRVAHSMTGRTVDYLELDPGFALVETTAPRELVGRTLAAAEVRARHGVSVVCVKSRDGAFGYATAETVLRSGDVVVVAGEIAAAEAFAALP